MTDVVRAWGAQERSVGNACGVRQGKKEKALCCGVWKAQHRQAEFGGAEEKRKF